MCDIPDVDSIRDIASRLKTGSDGKTLSENFLDFLFSINIDGQGLFADEEESKYSLIDLVSIVAAEGEANTEKLIRKNLRPDTSLSEVLRNSKLYSKHKEHHYRNLTMDLKKSQKIDSLIACPRCKKHEVTTRRQQTRAADEPMTSQNYCSACNYIFVN